jgi:hypothetical protein
MMSLTSHCQFLYKHIIVSMFCLKLTSHRISHLGFRLRRDIAMRNPFVMRSQFQAKHTNDNMFIEELTM